MAIDVLRTTRILLAAATATIREGIGTSGADVIGERAGARALGDVTAIKFLIAVALDSRRAAGAGVGLCAQTADGDAAQRACVAG